MAVPTYFGQGSAVSSATATVTPLRPASTATDDLLVLVVETANEPIAAPTDWTQVPASPQGVGTPAAAGATAVQVFWRRQPAAGYVDPVLPDAGDHIVARLFVLRGVSPTPANPITAAAVSAGDTAASSTSVVMPATTTLIADCLVVGCLTWDTDSATGQVTGGYTNASLASLTERFGGGSSVGNGGGFSVSTGTKAAAGAVSTSTATLLAAAVQGRVVFAVSGLAHVTTAWATSYKVRAQATWATSWVSRARGSVSWASSYTARQRASSAWATSWVSRQRGAVSWQSGYAVRVRTPATWATSWTVRTRTAVSWASGYVVHHHGMVAWPSSYVVRGRATSAWATSYTVHLSFIRLRATHATTTTINLEVGRA